MRENKYDNDLFFEQYSHMDRSIKGLQGAGEWPVLQQMLPDFTGKRVLDLGCGFGWHCLYAIQHGAKEVIGIDLSEKMIAEACLRNNDPHIQYLCGAIEDFEFQPETFDIVLSSLAFHYIESFGDICHKVGKVLSPSGWFVFSVEHPIFTAEGSQQWHYNNQGQPVHWPVDHYFTEGKRTTIFLGEQVTKYHKTLSTYLMALIRTGFEITEVAEPQPTTQMLNTIEGMRDELRRPMMMLIAARKH